MSAQRWLLDTSTFLFSVQQPDRLPVKARDIIDDLRNTILVSAVCAWEIGIKQSIDKFPADFDPMRAVADSRFTWLPVHSTVYPILRDLPPHHRDPFDRLLIAQAIAEGCTLVSGDRNIARYAVSVMW
jgi:PIN domain nuclease of toxin-antitoxin system